MSMAPRPPVRNPQLGFICIPPYRVQGTSVAGEESVVQVPELDICFDIGRAPRTALASPFVALSHGHMDHSAGLAYYFSQRTFQGMDPGTVLCPTACAEPIRNIMRAWVELEGQRTPFNVIAMEPEQEFAIKNNIFLRAFQTKHTAASLGFVVVEKRSKLRPDLQGLPQERIVELKRKGEQITEVHDIPLVCYTGDTCWGDHLLREDVLNAKVLITECTFLEPGHRDRAAVGKHLHLDDVVRLIRQSNADGIVLTHLSRRTHMAEARKQIDAAIPDEFRDRVHLLMDGRANRARYEKQLAAAEQAAAETA